VVKDDRESDRRPRDAAGAVPQAPSWRPCPTASAAPRAERAAISRPTSAGCCRTPNARASSRWPKGAGLRPRTLQAFLTYVPWDHDGLRDALQRRVAQASPRMLELAVIDETSHVKKGDQPPRRAAPMVRHARQGRPLHRDGPFGRRPGRRAGRGLARQQFVCSEVLGRPPPRRRRYAAGPPASPQVEDRARATRPHACQRPAFSLAGGRRGLRQQARVPGRPGGADAVLRGRSSQDLPRLDHSAVGNRRGRRSAWRGIRRSLRKGRNGK
jgi:hypothetical protein